MSSIEITQQNIVAPQFVIPIYKACDRHMSLLYLNFIRKNMPGINISQLCPQSTKSSACVSQLSSHSFLQISPEMETAELYGLHFPNCFSQWLFIGVWLLVDWLVASCCFVETVFVSAALVVL